MKTTDYDFFRKLITQQLEELRDKANRTVSSLKNAPEHLADPADRASADLEQNFMLRIRDRESKLINKLQSALERLNDGTYGICEECGNEISINRLKARPVTELCIDCKTRSERIEKVIGM
ncbi:MAG: RNA polymerase-binding protein DksA [Desulfobacterales bacterium]|nr:RNA polymerase-binding protein DksA [Desulfobacterales bacterium]MDD4073804.1 RNA polymerase-binding protein DksA [Desulfobacterales bacterium]MDD4392314.1 RNA polymerase-binding protein DksA [Desulfobacterales bacterium]